MEICLLKMLISNKQMLLMTCVVAILLSDFSIAKDWCYFGCENSLPHWGKHYPKCNGRKQSPINIDTQKVIKNQELASFELIHFSLPHTMKMLKNNGHTVECELKAGAVGVRGGGLKHKYTVLQFHFHWGGKDLMHHPGSEHSLNGHRSPLEMHIVSRRSDLNDSTAAKVQDGFAVMGFFIEGDKKEKEKEKTTSKVWESFTDYLQKIPRKGDKVRIMEPFSMHQLLKGVDLSKYYRYNGSLTTPPCDEAVVWTIFKDPIRIGRDLMHQMFSIGERSGLQAGPFSTPTLLLRSHAVVIAPVCGFALSC
ncbi:carbonic anhydrase 9 isoform X2 [Onychostoma macrolepis]|uniref:carbonic anhydrase 9 isoform X2 n=1 Tax=Onychostoma macrolepis TaxID=369639 RepID=UPI00272D9BBE|nr:carbonic anhydrase 9 isoform X2 [Onychostoma macrolepis]